MRIARGTKKNLIINVKNPDGSPKNLTGLAIRVLVRKHVDSTTVVITKLSSNDTITFYDQTQYPGKMRVKFVGADTAALDPGTYQYDPWLQDTDTEWVALADPAPFAIYRSVSEL